MKVPKPQKTAFGIYRIQLRLNGVSIPVLASTEAECKHQAELIKAEHRAGVRQIVPSDDMTLSEAIDKYISSRGKRLKARSVEQYEYIRDHRFQSVMHEKLKSISQKMLDDALGAELNKPSRKGGTVSPKTVRDAYMLMVSVLHKYAPRVNTGIDLPEIQRSFPELIPPQKIFEAVKGTDIELPVLLAMWLSLTMSEIRGLTKSKSVREDKLYIVEVVVDVKGKPERRPGGKEENRPRVLTIPPYIHALINKVDGDIIEPRSGHAVYMRFQNVLKAAGLPPMRFHALRHINASVMADLSIPTPVAQERGGWKTDSTMKKVYTHTFTDSRIDADNKLDNYFEKIVEKNENAHWNVKLESKTLKYQGF